MSTPKISVIVPVYNGEKYIAKCLNSLLAQTLSDIEIIVVNDGSNDNSSQIAHALAELDKRIVVIDKKNEGVSIARNLGLKMAKGEWIAFSDVDDYYYPEGLRLLYDVATKTGCKIILGNTERIARDGTISQRYPDKKHGSVYRIFPKGSLEMWGDLFHCSLFKPDEYLFTPGLAYLEDRLLILKLLSREGAYAFCEIPVYAHVKNEDSVLESKDGLRMAKHCFWAAHLMEEYACAVEKFKQEIKCDSESARQRAFTYFFAKKNASISQLSDIYCEFFGNRWGVYKYLFMLKWKGLKYNIKHILKVLVGNV